ncbi:MAG: 6-phosphofructokinase [Clostridia bacterium]|nr:6-phosphofructokinase [Clostridia bacterium]
MNKKLYGNAVVGQSGGPTAAINATLSGVIAGALKAEEIDTVYGMRNGIEGFMDERFIELNEIFSNDEALDLLAQTPAAALGSCRRKLPNPESKEEKDIAFYEKLFSVIEKYNIRYFFYIGGNDSMDTVAKMTRYASAIGYDIRIIGVPKTIDNDLVMTDHTPGFGSAAKYIATTVQEIIRDCAVYTVKAVTIVEIMGRDAGWLTASAAIGRVVNGIAPDYVYLPERDFDDERFFADIEKAFEKHPNVVIAVSEGLQYADGRYVGEGTQSGSTDVFGHKYLAGTGKALELAVKARFGCKVRSVELNLPQRCAAHLLSETDISESIRIGAGAVKAATEGVSGEMMIFTRKDGAEYYCDVEHKSVLEIANATKCVFDEFINDECNNVTDECCKYLLPLIEGEWDTKYEKGLPKHIIL